MKSILVSVTVFVAVFSGALAGMGLRRILPQNELGTDAKEVIRLAVGLLVTMTALVLGMLVSSANASYQDRKNELAEMASDFVVVDRLLESYGPETTAMRADLRALAQGDLDRLWPSERSQESQLRPRDDDGHVFYDQLQLLVPKNDLQAAAKAGTITAAIHLRHTYWLMFLGSEESSLSFPLLLVVVTWLTAIFISFGLFAPHNHAVFATLIVCAMAVSAAIFIIMALYSPFSGVMKISPFPMRDALSRMGG
jgi:hypothetical protein